VEIFTLTWPSRAEKRWRGTRFFEDVHRMEICAASANMFARGSRRLVLRRAIHPYIFKAIG
jgi:hypothetical protein